MPELTAYYRRAVVGTMPSTQTAASVNSTIETPLGR